MPQAESPVARAAAGKPPRASRSVRVSGWGGGAGAAVSLLNPATIDSLCTTVARLSARTGAIVRGMGRSYGDAAQLAGGVVLETTWLRQFALDEAAGTVTAQAGATIGALLEHLVPRGWLLPVVPGTQHISVGGAIASDVHGKNHGSAGTFGTHVESLCLLSADGDTLELRPGEELFRATVGGMGLTGAILSARIKLRRVASGLVSVDTDRVHGLEDALAALSAPGGQHRVAWLDLLSGSTPRGVVTRAEHLPARGPEPRERASASVRARATVPRWWPSGLLRVSTARAFNELRFRRTPRSQRGHVERFGSHMFPLDALASWPRLYGTEGFVQYQFVIPAGEERTLVHVIELLRRADVPCFLATLKDMGAANDAPLSFPIEGWTLALDLPRSAPGLLDALARCDRLVVGAGGRVYLTKDARLRPAELQAMYPELETWKALRDRVDPDRLWRSDLARRTGLVGPGGPGGP